MIDSTRQRALLSLLPLFFTSILIMGPYIAKPLGLAWPDVLQQSQYPLNSALIQLTFFFLQLFINRDCVMSGIDAAAKRHPNMDTLLLLGVLGSLGMAICSIDTVGKGTDYPMTMELYIFYGIALLTINAFSDSATIDTPSLPPASDTLLHISIWYVPSVMVLGLMAIAIGAYTDSLSVSYLFMVMLAGCPAAIKLIYPLLFLKISGMCQKLGLTIQKTEALYLLPEMDVLACSLFGILTRNDPVVKEAATQGILLDKTITLAATAEIDMEANPISMAIVHDARRRKLVLGQPSGINIMPNMGLEAIYNHMIIRVGNAQLLRSQRLHINAEMTTKADQFASKGMVAVYVNSGQYVRGVLGIEDPIAPEAEVAINELRDMSVDTVLLTGKDNATARYHAKQLQLEQSIGNLTPEEKAKEIQVRMAQGKTVAAYGHKPSFKPALDAADISIVPKSAPPELREDAHIVLEENDMRIIEQAVAMGLSWQRKLKHCVAVTFLLNLVLLTLAFMVAAHETFIGFHPLFPLLSAVFTIFGLVICVNTLSIE